MCSVAASLYWLDINDHTNIISHKHTPL